MNLIYSSVRATSETSRSCGRHWPTGDWGSPDECKDLLGCPERVWIPICQPHAHRGQCHNLEWRGGKDTGRYCSIGVGRGLEDDRTYNLSCTLLISGGSLFSLYTTRDPILSQHHNSQRVSSYDLLLRHYPGGTTSGPYNNHSRKTTAIMGKFSMSKTRAYNWYISLVAASCMVLYGYDASVFNAVQGSKHWVAYFDKPVCWSR